MQEMNRIRTKVVQELINTEQDFVKHLRDIVEVLYFAFVNVARCCVRTGASRERRQSQMRQRKRFRNGSLRKFVPKFDTTSTPQGYLLRCRSRPAMFSLEQIATIFGNVEHLYVFQKSFLTKLASCVNMQQPHASCVGECFLRFVSVRVIRCCSRKHLSHSLRSPS